MILQGHESHWAPGLLWPWNSWPLNHLPACPHMLALSQDRWTATLLAGGSPSPSTTPQFPSMHAHAQLQVECKGQSAPFHVN